jgi:hypothetical protein
MLDDGLLDGPLLGRRRDRHVAGKLLHTLATCNHPTSNWGRNERNPLGATEPTSAIVPVSHWVVVRHERQ